MRAALFLAALVSGASCLPQGTWTTRQFTTNDGLPQNSIQAMAMDSMEYLWLATDGGLVRYSGQEFKRFDLPGGDQPRSERMRSIIGSLAGEIIVLDARGNVYMVHAHHLVFPVARFSMQSRPFRGGYPNLETLLFAADPARSFPERERWKKDVRDIVPFNDHDWAIMCDQELLVYRDSTFRRSIPLPANDRFVFRSNGVLHVLDGAGFDYRATADDTVMSRPIEVEGWPAHALPNANDRLFWHAKDSVPVLLLGGAFYLVRLLDKDREPILEHLPVSVPPTGRVADALWNERLQMLLVASDISGLYMHRRHPFHTRGVGGPTIRDRSVYYAQVPVGGDTVLALNSGETPVVVTSDTAFKTSPWLTDINLNTAARMNDGRLLLASDSELVSVDFRNRERRTIADCGDFITCIRTVGDTCWIGTLTTIGFYADGQYQPVLDRPVRPESGVYAIRRLPDGRIMFADCHGLFRLERDPWAAELVRGSDGLCVRALEVIDQEVFVGTYGDGPFLLDGDSLRALPKDHNDFLSHAHGFMKDGAGHIWTSTNRGLFRTSWHDLKRWKADPALPLRYEYFGARYGITNMEFNGGCEPSWVMLPDGTASFPTMGGLIQFDPEDISGALGSGYVLIESLTADGVDLQRYGSRDLSPDVRQVIIGFSVSFWGDPVDIQLEYRLRETDVWQPLDPDQRSIVVPEPQPGRYEVELRLVGAAIDSPQYHAIYFSVETPFYRSKAGIALIVLLFAALVYVLFKAWARGLERRNSALERAVVERTQRLHAANTELQRSVRVKERLIAIITHDIVSPLRFIAQVARRTWHARAGNPADQTGAMDDIHFAAEKLHSNAQNLLSWMKHQEGGLQPQPRHVVMSMLVDDLFDRIRPEAATKGLRLENDVQIDDVLMVDKDLLSIVVNNLVMNAVAYTEKGVVRIAAMTAENHYHLIVSDSGPGLSIKARNSIERIRAGDHRSAVDENGKGIGGLGYIIVQGIMELLGGDFEVVGEGGNGTTIVLRLPMKAGHVLGSSG